MSWYFTSTSLLNNRHSVGVFIWPDDRIFVDWDLACPKTLDLNQQSLRLVEQFERTSCSDICIYMFNWRDIQTKVCRSSCLFLLICSAQANTCSCQERGSQLSKSTAKCAMHRTGQKKKTSNSRSVKTIITLIIIIIMIIPKKIEVCFTMSVCPQLITSKLEIDFNQTPYDRTTLNSVRPF